MSLSVGFVLGRGRVQRACACGVEGSYSRSSSECRREKARLCACSNIPTISSDGSGGLAWQGRRGQQTGECLADVSPMDMGMGINRGGVGTKEAQSGVHEVTFNHDVDRVFCSLFPSEEEAIWKNCTVRSARSRHTTTLVTSAS